MKRAYDPHREFYTPEGCYINELSNRADDPACSIARARVAPGVTTQLHALHQTVERYVILQGQGEVEVAGAAPLPVGPLDVVHIPAGASQRIANTGSTDLVFLAVCTPRFRPENYVAL
jgi:mannose-6-phosphate isomerase-like protein (cupin superfamily)